MKQTESFSCAPLKMKAARSFRASVTHHQSTERYIAEDFNLTIQGCGNLKSFKIFQRSEYQIIPLYFYRHLNSDVTITVIKRSSNYVKNNEGLVEAAK